MTGRRGETPFDTYLREILAVPLLTPAEEKALARIVQGPDVIAGYEARERMIRANLRLVVSTAKRWLGRGLPLPDLVEEGNLGLVHAVALFDPERQIRFSTYATWWIEQAIRRALVGTTRTVRIPRHMSQELSRWRRWARQQEQKTGQAPEAEEVAAAMDAPEARRKLLVRLFRGASRGNVSLDVLFEETQSVADPRAVPAADVELSAGDLARLDDHVAALPEREAQIVRLRYGLGGRERPMTLREIGRTLGLSRERVRQLERAAVRKLKSALER